MQFRVEDTATRAWTYRFGTLDVEWQCGRHCHSALSAQFRVEDTATRAWTYRFGTLDVEWQCEGVRPVRSTSSGSVVGTATRP